MEDPYSASAFTPLATLHLPGPHLLHPQACNPTMDLVMLLGQGGPGRGKAVSPETHTRLVLWRMSGSRVWENDAGGEVRGLTWSHDGLYLTILVMKPAEGSTPTMALEHFSVHTGELVKSIKLEINDAEPSSDTGEDWWDLRWTESTDDWPKPQRGSAGMIIDSLPRPTPVEPPLPANALPFMIPGAIKVKKASTISAHPKLDSFPSLLPTIVPSQPHLLNVSSPDRSTSKRLLTGTLPLGTGAVFDELLLKLARSCDRLSGFLDIVLRGLEVVDNAFKEGDKQTMIWREELEECGEQRGLTKVEVHSCLFQLLVTGRGSPAVTEWLGNRLTGRTIMKWEASLENSFKTIQQVFAESVGPSIERVILLLEEMKGWSQVSTYSHLGLDTQSVERTLAVAVGFAKLIERMRQQAQEEFYAATEWMKWLKYEVGRAAAQDISTDAFLPSLCDTKLVWYFMKHGFVKSPLLVHMPQQFRAKPTDDLLPDDFDANPRPAKRSMSEVLAETIRSLTGRSKPQETEPEPSRQQEQEQEVSIDSSVDMSFLDASGVRASSPEIPSSPDTVSQKSTIKEEVEISRVKDLEPWVWANTLVTQLKDLVKSRDIGQDAPTGWPAVEHALVDTRVVNGQNLTAFMYPTHEMVHILANKDRCARLELPGMKVLAMSFFDDVELALLVELKGGIRMFCTIVYAKFNYERIEPIKDLSELSDSEYEEPAHELEETSPRFHYLGSVHPSREFKLGSIAINGRKGRRVGCILVEGGTQVEVLDMEEDDGEEEEEEEDGQDMSGIVEE